MARTSPRTSDMLKDLSPTQLDAVRGGDGEKKKRPKLDPIIITKPTDASSPILA
jgi:hypothetical protein